jgi:hypothetical protein
VAKVIKIIGTKRRKESFIGDLRVIGPAPAEAIGPQAGDRAIGSAKSIRSGEPTARRAESQVKNA